MNKTYKITLHVNNDDRSVQMNVPSEVMHDADSRTRAFTNLLESACNMFGIPDLSESTPVPDPRVDYATYRAQAGCSITCATVLELHKIICNKQFTRHYRRMALVEHESRQITYAFKTDHAGNRYLDLRED